jgi:hypothetical protein
MGKIAAIFALCAAMYSLTLPSQGGPADVTYADQIGRILHRKCAGCHFPGGPSPFPLLTYEDAVQKAAIIRQVALTKAMPPTHAMSDVGLLALQEPLTDEEMIQIQVWARTGTPRGDASREPVPPAYSTGWGDFKPDTVLRTAGYVPIAKEGYPYWISMAVPIGDAAGLAVVGLKVRSRSPGEVRQVILALDGGTLAQRDRGTGYLTNGWPGAMLASLVGVWAPGFSAWSPPTGYGVPTGRATHLIAQALVVPGGKDANAGLEIGLKLADAADVKPLRWKEMGNSRFSLPANEYVVLKDSWIPDKPILIVGIAPVARLFATSVQVRMTPPTSGPMHLLTIPAWDYWKAGAYNFPVPPVIPQGLRLEAVVTYDNGNHCRANEGRKPATVRSGTGPRDESFRVLIQYAD